MSYLTHYEQTILDNIDLADYGIEQANLTKFELINEVYKIFVKEYGFNVKRLGETKAFAEWLQGLPSVLTVPFYWHEVIKQAEANGFEFMTEQAEQKYKDMYWHNLSAAFFTLKENL